MQIKEEGIYYIYIHKKTDILYTYTHRNTHTSTRSSVRINAEKNGERREEHDTSPTQNTQTYTNLQHPRVAQ